MRLWSAEEVEPLRVVGRDVWSAIEVVAAHCVPGISGRELDAIAERELRDRVLESALQGVEVPGGRFSGVICVSIDSDAPDAAPTDQCLRDGQIVTLDIAAKRRGLVCDLATSICVGETCEQSLDLLRAAREITGEVIKAMKPGTAWSSVIEHGQALASTFNVEILRGFFGHGIGTSLHERPALPYTLGDLQTDFRLTEGMVCTVEPLISDGLRSVFEERMVWLSGGGAEVICGDPL